MHLFKLQQRRTDHLVDMLDAVIVLISFGFTNLGRIQYHTRFRLAQIRHRFRPRDFVTAGLYYNRRGALCIVEHNDDGWLDGLPFKVTLSCSSKKGPHYTVDHDGLVWPATPWAKPDDLVPND